MRVLDISRVAGFGAQVTVRLRTYGGTGFIDEVRDSTEWGRWKATSKLLARDHNIPGELSRVDFQGQEAVLTYREQGDVERVC